MRLAVVSTWPEGQRTKLVYELEQERIVIGRRRGSDVHIPHPAVSGHHATISSQSAGLVVVDEGSTNGTRVNGTRVPQGRPKTLRTGDVVEVGGFELTVSIGVPVAEATSADRTAALARQIVGEVLGFESERPAVTVRNGPSAGTSASVPLPPGRLVIGRGEHVELPLSDADLSREHAEVRPDLDGCVLVDLGSKNGTFVNDKPIVERRLRDGDEIRVGRTVLSFRDPMEARVREISDATEIAMETPAAVPETRAAGVDALVAAVESPEAPRADVAPPAGLTADAPAPTAATPEPPRAPPTRPRGGLGADAVIYLLAGAVLALSIAGLFVLLR